MNRAAKAVLEEFGDVVLAFGESDEYRYVLVAEERELTTASSCGGRRMSTAEEEGWSNLPTL